MDKIENGAAIFDYSPDGVLCVLNTQENTGKFLIVRMINSTLKLCLEGKQNATVNAPLVNILTNKSDLEKKAFKFHYKEERYWLKANTNKLQLVKDGDIQTEPFWFVMKSQNGTNFILQFVEEGTIWYLSSEMIGGREIVTTSKANHNSITVTQEMRN